MNQSEYQERREARRSEEREHHRQQILDAARELFAQKGYARTAVQEIAAASGFSVGHIYNLIGNKKTLYEMVNDREYDSLARVVENTIAESAQEPAIAQLDRLVDATLGFISDRRFFIQIHQHEVRLQDAIETHHPATHKKKQSIKDRVDAQFRRLFEAGIAAGHLAPLDPDDLILVFEDLVSGFVARWAMSGFKGDIRQKAPIIKQVLWNGIAADAAARRRVQ